MRTAHCHAQAHTNNPPSYTHNPTPFQGAAGLAAGGGVRHVGPEQRQDPDAHGVHALLARKPSEAVAEPGDGQDVQGAAAGHP